jgi:hypothetical protein
MYLSGSSRQCIAAGLVGDEGLAFVPRRGRCVDDFVTFHRQRPERRIVRSASFWYRRKASRINGAERSLNAPLQRS